MRWDGIVAFTPNLSSSRDSRPLTFTVSRCVFVMLMSRTNRVTVEVLIELAGGDRKSG